MLTKKNPDDLTPEEVAFLRSNAVDPEVKAFAARRQEALAVETSAYRKLGARQEDGWNCVVPPQRR